MLRNIEGNLTDCFLQKTIIKICEILKVVLRFSQQTMTHFLKTIVSKKSQL